MARAASSQELPDKARVRQTLAAALESQLAQASRAQRSTQAGATHEESRPENDKDTRALESSYLARGQARRVAELSEAVARVSAMELRDFDAESRVALSALVELVEVDGGERAELYFVAPAGGGMKLEVEGDELRVLTPSSPLGRSVLGRRQGDDVEVRTPQGLREYALSRLR